MAQSTKNIDQSSENTISPEKYTIGDYLRFIIPSALGAFLFLTPIPVDGKTEILFSLLTGLIKSNFTVLITYLLVAVTAVSAALTIYYSLINKKKNALNPHLASIFVTTPVWIILRFLGAVFAAMVTWKIGPEIVIADVTGGTVINLLGINLLVLFFLASMALPLLTDYGFMEFFGSLVSKAFQFLFRLPGRSAIDGLASWLGAAVIGVMLTVQQYEKGTYSRREAATVATSFSIASFPFCLIVANVSGIAEYFWNFYASVIFIGLILALIMPRIPPLSFLPDTYKRSVGKTTNEEELPGENSFQRGIRLGLKRGKGGPSPVNFIKEGLRNVMSTWFGILPATMGIATLALILVEFTPIFQTISIPIASALELLGVAEASKAAPALLVGFADMYLPALVAKGIDDIQTRFMIAIIAVTQLIYMSEVGAYLIRANIGLHIGHLIMIFVVRTIIAVPIAVMIGRYIVF